MLGMLQLQPVYFPATALGSWPALACCIATSAARDAHSRRIQENKWDNHKLRCSQYHGTLFAMSEWNIVPSA